MDRICGIRARQTLGDKAFMTLMLFRREKARARVMASVIIVREADTSRVNAHHPGAREKREQDHNVRYVAGKGIQERIAPVKEEASTRKRAKAKIQDSGEEKVRHGEERKEEAKEKASQEKARGCMR